MRDYIIDGVPLRDPQGQWTIDYTRSRTFGEIAREIESASIYGIHGAVESSESFFNTGKETVVLNVIADDKEVLNTNLRGLSGLLQRRLMNVVAAPQRSPLAGGGLSRAGRTFDVDPDLQRQALCRTAGSLASEYVNETTYRLTAILERIQAFWFSVAEYTSDAAVLGGGSTVIDLSDELAGSQAPITQGMVRIKGPMNNGAVVTIADGSNLQRSISIETTQAVLATQWLLIDFLTCKAYLKTVDDWALAGTDKTPWIGIAGDGPFFLSPQTIEVSFPGETFGYSSTVLQGGASTAEIEFRLRRSYTS